MKIMNENRQLLNLVKYPIITDKATKNIEDNVYCFAVKLKANKNDIKKAIEYIFNVKIKKINTLKKTKKNKRIGKFTGSLPQYKKVIIKLNHNYSIDLFKDN